MSNPIHPDDSREAFGVLALHFGGATEGTRESLVLYRRLEDSWDKAMQALASAQERRERLGWDRELDRMHAYEQARTEATLKAQAMVMDAFWGVK